MCFAANMHVSARMITAYVTTCTLSVMSLIISTEFTVTAVSMGVQDPVQEVL